MVWAGLAGICLLPARVMAVCSTNAEGCVECGPHWGSWSGTCPTVVSNGSVNPTQICQSPGTAPTQPTVVPPVYNTTVWTQTGTYDCTNTVSTNTVTVSYTVGSVQWVPPLPSVLTNAFTSTAKVPVTSSDTNKCPSPGLVVVGSCSWCVSFKTTNCASAGYIQFTNAVVTPSNACLGTAFSATADQLKSNATVVVTTTCPCSTNPPTSVTNSIQPTVVSNWWTVSGPGTFTASGGGPTANFTPTNGGNGTVTLYLKYKNNIPCDTNPVTISVALSFNAIQITNQCVATTPTNRARTTIGVGEEVNLWLVGPPSGTYTWSTSAGSVSPTTGAATTLTAPSNAATATVPSSNASLVRPRTR